MKVVILAALALALAGCEHLYGGMDAGRLASHGAPLGSPVGAR
jgi:hypothetical protein